MGKCQHFIRFSNINDFACMLVYFLYKNYKADLELIGSKLGVECFEAHVCLNLTF